MYYQSVYGYFSRIKIAILFFLQYPELHLCVRNIKNIGSHHWLHHPIYSEKCKGPFRVPCSSTLHLFCFYLFMILLSCGKTYSDSYFFFFFFCTFFGTSQQYSCILLLILIQLNFFLLLLFFSSMLASMSTDTQ